jgi:hypothetical protein
MRKGCWVHLQGVAVGLLRKQRAWQRFQDVVACVTRVVLNHQPHGLHRRHLLVLACDEIQATVTRAVMPQDVAPAADQM